jgi:large subunit ribosomal protein L18
MNKRTAHKRIKRLKNKARIRKKVDGSLERPRLTVYKSARHIYAQLVDDTKGQTLVSVSTLTDDIKGVKKTEAAKQIGALLAKRALEKKIKNVVFDRSGYVFHGRIKAVADGAREAGLDF